MASPTDRVRYRIGPVAAGAATAWLESARHNLLRALEAGDSLPFKVPEDVAAHFLDLLAQWAAAAAQCETFLVEAEQDADVVRRLFTYWLNLVSLSEEQRSRIGMREPPIRAMAFADAVRRGMLDSLAGHVALSPLADVVRAVRPTRHD